MVGLRSPEGDLAVVGLSAAGRARIKPDMPARRLHAKWFNPRRGAWSPADDDGEGYFVAPDEQDCPLLLSVQ